MQATAACLFTVLATLVLPVTAFIWFACKRDRLAAPFLFGALTFFIFQVLTRIPLLQYVLPGMGWYIAFPMVSPVLYALFLGFTAALFEEGGRYLVMRSLMRGRTRWIDGIAFGIGHGGLEAVLLVGTAAVATLLQPGGLAAASTDGFTILAAGFERLFTIVLHVGWSLMVLHSVRNGKPGGLLLAVALHTAIDAAVVMLQPVLSMLALEGILVAASALIVLYIVRSKKSWEAVKS